MLIDMARARKIEDVILEQETEGSHYMEVIWPVLIRSS